MPIRIKPIHDLKPCLLDIDGIKAIAERVCREFPSASYAAVDGAWEIYDETKDTFLEAIYQREKLDSLLITGATSVENNVRDTVLNVKPPKRFDVDNWDQMPVLI